MYNPVMCIAFSIIGHSSSCSRTLLQHSRKPYAYEFPTFFSLPICFLSHWIYLFIVDILLKFRHIIMEILSSSVDLTYFCNSPVLQHVSMRFPDFVSFIWQTHSGYFYLLAIVNSPTVNIHIEGLVQLSSISVCSQKNGIAVSLSN